MLERVVIQDVIFFFQAEDGIRDIGVTGVQTCALPIYRRQLKVSQIGREAIIICSNSARLIIT